MKLNKQQVKRLGELRGKLADSLNLVNAEAAGLADALGEAVRSINKTIEGHNALVNDARHFVEEVAEGLRDEWDDKSERWQESEAGQQALSFVEEWENADLDNLEAVAILEPDLPDAKNALAKLPEEDD